MVDAIVAWAFIALGVLSPAIVTLAIIIRQNLKQKD